MLKTKLPTRDIRIQEIVAEARQKKLDSRFKEVDSPFNEVAVRLQSLHEIIERNDVSQKELIVRLTQDFQFERRLADIEQELERRKSTAA
jgi:hypothetical protein